RAAWATTRPRPSYLAARPDQASTPWRIHEHRVELDTDRGGRRPHPLGGGVWRVRRLRSRADRLVVRARRRPRARASQYLGGLRGRERAVRRLHRDRAALGAPPDATPAPAVQ